MPFTVTVDKDFCISSGKCVADAPGGFRFDADEIAEPVAASPPIPTAQLLEVARNCPSGAIEVRDDSGEPVDLD